MRGRPGGSGCASAEDDEAVRYLAQRRADLQQQAPRRDDPKRTPVAEILKIATPMGQLDRDAKIRQYVTLIKRTVNDPALFESVAYNAAQAAVDGDWPLSELQGVLNAVEKVRREGFRKVTAGIYFAQAVKKSRKAHEGATR